MATLANLFIEIRMGTDERYRALNETFDVAQRFNVEKTNCADVVQALSIRLQSCERINIVTIYDQQIELKVCVISILFTLYYFKFHL